MADVSAPGPRDVLVTNKFPVKFVLGGAGVVAMLVVLGFLVGRPAWRQHCARRDVEVIALAMDGFAMENGAYPKGELADICALLRGESRAGQNTKKLDYIEASAQEMNATGEFLDPWGTPYRIEVAPTARVYSCGPNRKDERGSGDDIRSW